MSTIFVSLLPVVISEDPLHEPKIFEIEEERVSSSSVAPPQPSVKGRLLKSIYYCQTIGAQSLS